LKICYFRSGRGNFGDDINPWLWPKLLGEELFQKNDGNLFIGIGSILSNGFRKLMHDDFENHKHKIIFGAGIRDTEEDLDFINDFDMVFVRGPISSKKIFGDESSFISDPAYCIRLLDEYRKIDCSKKYEVAIMPYYRTMRVFPWERFCQRHGYCLISPFRNESIESKIQKIAQSKCLISEAMHGAIVADALRVPWVRLRFYSHIFEKGNVSNLKWKDWLLSMSLKPELMINVFKKNNYLYKFGNRRFIITPIVSAILNKKIKQALNNPDCMQVSSEEILESKLKMFYGKIEYIKDKYN